MLFIIKSTYICSVFIYKTLKLIVMKAKQTTLYTLTFILALFVGVLTSCSNNNEVAEINATRDYQTDFKVLAKFVDINKTVGEYYLNVNKTGQ